MNRYFICYCAVCIVCIITITKAGAQTSHYQSSSKNGSTSLNIEGDMTYNPGESKVTYRNGQSEYVLKLKDDKVSDLYVNGKKIPADSIYLYNTVIGKIKEQIKIDRAQAAEDRKQADLDRQQAEEDRKQSVKDQAQAELDRQQAEEDRKQAEEDRKQSIKDQEEAKKDQAQAELDRQQAMREQEDAKKEQAEAEQDQKQAELDRQQAVEDQKQALEDQKQAEVDRKQAEADRAMVKAMIKQIVAAGIVPNEESLSSFMLGADEFMVNGKKQSEELHKKFAELYLKHPGWCISFGNFSGRNGIFMNKEDLKEQH